MKRLHPEILRNDLELYERHIENENTNDQQEGSVGFKKCFRKCYYSFYSSRYATAQVKIYSS